MITNPFINVAAASGAKQGLVYDQFEVGEVLKD